MEHSKSLKSCERDTKYSRFRNAASLGGGVSSRMRHPDDPMCPRLVIARGHNGAMGCGLGEVGMVISLGTTDGRINRTPERRDINKMRTVRDWSHEGGVRIRNGIKTTFYLT